MSEIQIPNPVEFQVPDGVRLLFRWGAAGDLEAAARRVIQTVSDWLDHLNIPKILEVTGLTEQNIPWLVHETRANAARPIDAEQTAVIWDDLLKPGD